MSTSHVEAIYPLSPMQQGMLFHSVFGSGEDVYVEQFTVRLRGAIDVDAFREAWTTIAHRHPILRSSFNWEDADQPVQIVHREAVAPFVHCDWIALSGDEQRQQFEAW